MHNMSVYNKTRDAGADSVDAFLQIMEYRAG